MPAGTGKKGRTDSPASGGGGAPHSRGVWTLPHEDNQLGRKSQGGLRYHQLLGSPAPDTLLLCFAFFFLLL